MSSIIAVSRLVFYENTDSSLLFAWAYKLPGGSNNGGGRGNRRLTRKTLGFSKRKKLLISSLNIYFGIYHFVKTHKGLRIQIDQKERKWMQRTPMMAAGITDHVWTLSELINFRV